MISFCQKQSRELLITQHCYNLVVASETTGRIFLNLSEMFSL